MNFQKLECYMILGLLLGISSIHSADDEGLTEVWGVQGGRVEIPCPVSPKVPNDTPVLVLWYLASNTTPVYSYDARMGEFTTGDRWADKHAFGDRSYFSAVSEPPSLILEPLHPADDGVFTCRMDYRRSPSSTVSTNLTVIVPPGPPVVLWNGVGVVGSVGPLRENSQVTLSCRSSGGSPPPVLTWWWRGSRLSHQTSNVTLQHHTGSLVVEATVRLRATRGLQGALLTCHAHPPSPQKPNRHVLLQPRTASVSLNITLPPIEVSISGAKGPVSTGSAIQLACRSVGSNPPAKLTWWRGHNHLTEVVHSVEDGGNITTATLTVVTSRQLDGATLACTAANPLLPNSPATRTVRLEVLYPPVASLRLGSVLNASDIEEGDDIFFECDVRANPTVHRIEWQHNGAMLHHDLGSGIVMSGLSLALQKLRKKHSGTYNCIAYNSEGRNSSNTFHLTVRHAPQCTGGTNTKTIGAARGTPSLLTCHVDAVPAKDISWEWARIREDNTEEKIPDSEVRKDGVTSSTVLTPLTPGDYGYVTCRALNVIGRQREACLVHLVPAGPPDPPTNCSATPVNRGLASSLAISCHEGFDGGLPQEFLLVVQQEREVVANLTSEFPEWVVDKLAAGASITIKVTAMNAHGRSEALRLEVHTPLAQHREALDGSSKNQETLLGATTLLGALVGVVIVLVILIVVSIVIVRHAKPRPKNKPNHEHTIMSNTPTDSNWESDNPDIVPSIHQRQHSRETLTISQQSIPSPRLHTLMQRHSRSCLPLHEQGQDYIQRQGQSVPHILINNHPPKHSSLGEITGFDMNDTASDTTFDSDVESVIEVTDLATKGLTDRRTNDHRFHLSGRNRGPSLQDIRTQASRSMTVPRSPHNIISNESGASKPLLDRNEKQRHSPKIVNNLNVKIVPNTNSSERSRKLPKTPDRNRTDRETSEKEQLLTDRSDGYNQLAVDGTPPPKPPRVFNLTQTLTPSSSPGSSKKGSRQSLQGSKERIPLERLGTSITAHGPSTAEEEDTYRAPLAQDEVNGAYREGDAAKKLLRHLNGIAGKAPDRTGKVPDRTGKVPDRTIRVSPSRETTI